MKNKTDLQNLIKEIQGRKFWIASAPVLFQNCYPWIGFIDMRKYLGFGFKIVILTLKNNYLWQFIDEDENYLITKRIVEMFIKKTIFKPFKVWQKFQKKLIKNFQHLNKINLKELSNKELVSEYLNFVENFTNEWTIPLVMEGTAVYTEKSLLPKFKKELNTLDNKTISEYFTILTQPEKLSFIGKERLDFLKICLIIFRNKKILKFLKKKIKISKIKDLDPPFYKQLLEHQKKFYWVRTNYFKTEPITIFKFFLFLKEEIKNKTKKEINKEYRDLKNYSKNILKRKRDILREIKISQRLKKELEAISFFSYCFDERKEMALRGSHYAAELLKELADRVKISYLTLDCALPEEMPKIISEGKKKWFKILSQRKKKFIFVYQYKTKWQIYAGIKAENLWKILFKEEQVKVKMIEGITVSRGERNYTGGRVRVVINPFKDPFRPGEILVTTMTRPEFLPLLKKARGIITDEGGMTCHAAIISRELNIPCIVGTKKATKVFKNGDRIILRLNHGKIEKVNL